MPVAAVVSLAYTVVYTTLGYLIPGYQTFKAIERRGTEDARDWAIYWAVLATFYCLQWPIDLALCWLPFYYIAKLGFLLALWHPSSKLALTLYTRVFSPLVSTYEAEIDALYMDARTKGMDMMSTHANTFKTQARNLSGRAAVTLKSVQQKALDRARAAGNAREDSAGSGLHTE